MPSIAKQLEIEDAARTSLFPPGSAVRAILAKRRVPVHHLRP
jgi:hypothetical protein